MFLRLYVKCIREHTQLSQKVKMEHFLEIHVFNLYPIRIVMAQQRQEKYTFIFYKTNTTFECNFLQQM